MVERRSGIKHISHISHLLCVPTPNVLVERTKPESNIRHSYAVTLSMCPNSRYVLPLKALLRQQTVDLPYQSTCARVPTPGKSNNWRGNVITVSNIKLVFYIVSYRSSLYVTVVSISTVEFPSIENI